MTISSPNGESIHFSFGSGRSTEMRISDRLETGAKGIRRCASEEQFSDAKRPPPPIDTSSRPRYQRVLAIDAYSGYRPQMSTEPVAHDPIVLGIVSGNLRGVHR
jgi:hypothetical protein